MKISVEDFVNKRALEANKKSAHPLIAGKRLHRRIYGAAFC